MHSAELRVLAYFLPLFYNNSDISDFSFKLKIQNILNHSSFLSWFRASVAVVFRHFTAAEFCNVLSDCFVWLSFFPSKGQWNKSKWCENYLVFGTSKLRSKYLWVCWWGPMFLCKRSKGHGSGCTKTFSGMHRYLYRVYCLTPPTMERISNQCLHCIQDLWF